MLVLVAPANASPLWHDSKGGVSRDYYLRAAGLPWDRKLGDWVDKSGIPWGDDPYAKMNLFPSMKGDYISLRVTELVVKWFAGRENQGFMIRADRGTAIFLSREGKLHPPVLELVLQQGKKQLVANLDASIDKSTAYPLGEKNFLSVSPAVNTALWFDLGGLENYGRLLRADLKLFVEKVSGGRVDVNLYELWPAPKSSRKSEKKQGIAAQFPADKGLEKHSAVYYAQQFEGGKWDVNGLSDGFGGELTVLSEHLEYEPLDGRSLSVTIKQGEKLGLNRRFKFGNQGFEEPEEAYFRYYLRLSDNWDQTVSGGKLPGFSGTYGKAGWGGRRPNGHDGWSSRGQFLKTITLPNRGGLRTPVGNYVYHLDQQGNYGSSWIWNQSGGALLENNRWYCVEQYIHLNAPGEANGVLTTWLDGKQVFSKKNIEFRASTDLKIEEVWFNVYHGGTANAKKTQHLFIDNVVISKEYIGPVAQTFSH